MKKLLKMENEIGTPAIRILSGIQTGTIGKIFHRFWFSG
jgi:hypothetical protein